MDNRKKRSVYLIILGSIMLINLIMGIYTVVMISDMYDFYETHFLSTDLSSMVKTVAIVMLIIGCGLGGLFLGFAFMYNRSSDNVVAGRRWPYITMVVLSGISMLSLITLLTQIGKPPLVTDNDRQNQILEMYFEDKHSQGLYDFTRVLSAIFVIANLTLWILGLVLTNKIRNSYPGRDDIDYSNPQSVQNSSDEDQWNQA